MEEYFLKNKYIKEDIENFIDLNQKKKFCHFFRFYLPIEKDKYIPTKYNIKISKGKINYIFIK
jgi:hypothetical protein